MESRLDCIPCLVNQAFNIGKMIGLPGRHQEALLRDSIQYIGKQPFSTKAPLISKKIWQFALKYAISNDPMRSIRRYYNYEMLKLEQGLNNEIGKSSTPLHSALKMAIAGNIIDFGAPHDFDLKKVKDKIFGTLQTPLSRDDSQSFFNRISQGGKLLYIGDNCGEIVLDKLFIKQLKQWYPELKITFAVRGGPVLNDVISEDAKQVGIHRYAFIIANGDNAPSTLIEKTSREFKRTMRSHETIIAKGQGNFEGLSEYPKNELYYLFMAKCNYISELTGSKLYGLMCLKNNTDAT